MIMPHRLITLIIAIVGLSTALISIPTTTRDAHALNFDALDVDYSIWIENQSTITLLYHFKPHNVPTSLPYSHLLLIDLGLNVPSGTNAKSNYITNDFEVSGWLWANLDEINLKGNPFSDNGYKSRIDSFDPSQVVIKKFTLIFLVIASICIIFLFFTCTGLVFHDKFVFRTVLQNCIRSDKSISWARTKKEIRSFSQFVLKIFIIIVLYIVFNAILLFLCHDYIAAGGYSTLVKALKIDPEEVINEVSHSGLKGRGSDDFSFDRKWKLEKNVSEQEMIVTYNAGEGDIGEEYEEWIEEKGFSSETGRFGQEFLWNYWYILIALMLYFGFSFYFSVFKLSLGMFMHYKNSVSRLRIFYYSIDHHRLVKKTLETDQPVCSGNNSENASK